MEADFLADSEDNYKLVFVNEPFFRGKMSIPRMYKVLRLFPFILGREKRTRKKIKVNGEAVSFGVAYHLLLFR
jgi:hypothetical protein